MPDEETGTQKGEVQDYNELVISVLWAFAWSPVSPRSWLG